MLIGLTGLEEIHLERSTFYNKYYVPELGHVNKHLKNNLPSWTIKQPSIKHQACNWLCGNWLTRGQEIGVYCQRKIACIEGCLYIPNFDDLS